MAGEPLLSLVSTVDRARGVIPSATALVNGIHDRVAAAIQRAMELGATEAELADLVGVNQDLAEKVDALTSAVASHPQ